MSKFPSGKYQFYVTFPALGNLTYMASTVWRGYITFGLISIPVRLFRAARPERVPLRRLARTPGPSPVEVDEDDPPEPVARSISTLVREPLKSPPQSVRSEAEPILSPVKQASIVPQSSRVVPETAVVKGFEYEKNRFVEIDREELKELAPKTSTEMQIQEFVRLEEIDPVYLETSYYVVPEDAAEKSYALLFAALRKTGLVALAQFAMRGREHVVMLRPGQRGLMAHTMFYASEVRAEEEYRADPNLVVSKELQLAEMLVGSLTAPFEPEKYRDTYREKLEALIAGKVAGKPAAETATPQRKSAPVFDIADALRKSLENLESSRKPVASAPVRSKTKSAKSSRA